MNMPTEEIDRSADVTEIPLPAAGPGHELAAILTSCNDRMQELQQQATDIVFAEAATIQRAWLNAVIAVAQMAPHEADHDNARRLVGVVNEWFRTVAQTQAAMLDLLGRSVVLGGRGALPFVDRRRMAVVINFPDRRRAA